MRIVTTEAGHWLYELIKAEKPDIEPTLSARSTINWARSLAHEIESEHGGFAAAQFDSCVAKFAKQKKASTAPASARTFEPLFSSLTHAVA